MQLNGLGFDWGSLITGAVDVGGKVYSTVQQSKAQTAAIKSQTAAEIAARQDAARIAAMRSASQPGLSVAGLAPLALPALAVAAFFFLKKRRG